jgi:hypothetical protein
MSSLPKEELVTLKTARVLPSTIAPEKAAAPSPAAESRSPSLPTFDLEVGWKYVYNSETGMHDQVPLTLLDILYPLEDEAIVMPESPCHCARNWREPGRRNRSPWET